MKALLLLLLLSGCVKHVEPLPLIHRGQYVYQEIEPGVFVIIARTEEALNQALSEIQCGICSIEPNGTSFVVRRVK